MLQLGLSKSFVDPSSLVDATNVSEGVKMSGSSTQGIQTVLHPVSDLEPAKAVYGAVLGVAPQTDSITTSASRPRASRSGWCLAAGRST
jgi:hypothetical protein